MKLTTGMFFPDEVVAGSSACPIGTKTSTPSTCTRACRKGADGLPASVATSRPHRSAVVPRRGFFRDYRGKRVVFGHTGTQFLPPELSGYTPEDPTDLWAGEACCGLDTGCGNGGFLTALELPALQRLRVAVIHSVSSARSKARGGQLERWLGITFVRLAPAPRPT